MPRLSENLFRAAAIKPSADSAQLKLQLDNVEAMAQQSAGFFSGQDAPAFVKFNQVEFGVTPMSVLWGETATFACATGAGTLAVGNFTSAQSLSGRRTDFKWDAAAPGEIRLAIPTVGDERVWLITGLAAGATGTGGIYFKVIESDSSGGGVEVAGVGLNLEADFNNQAAFAGLLRPSKMVGSGLGAVTTLSVSAGRLKDTTTAVNVSVQLQIWGVG